MKKQKQIKKKYSKQKNYITTQRKYFTLQITLIILLLTSLISFVVWQNIEGLTLNTKLKQLTKQSIKLQNIYYEKLIEYEKLRSGKQIKRKAMKLLKMTPTKRKDFILLGIKNKKELIKELKNNKNKNKKHKEK